MSEVIFSENSRFVLSDLESIYELSSGVDQTKCFINDRTALKLQNRDVHLFINLDQEQFTLGIPVIGIPVNEVFEAQERFYIEDYQQFKIFRTTLEGYNPLADGVDKIFEVIEELVSNLFEAQEERPEIVRLLFKNWPQPQEIFEENSVLVDFFLD